MSRTLTYMAFAMSYVLSWLAFSLPTLFLSGGSLNYWLGTVAPIFAAPAALLVMQRAGRISVAGLLFASCAVAAGIYTLTWSVFHWVSLKSGSDGVPFLRIAQWGGWRFALSFAIQVFAPVVWHPFVSRLAAKRLRVMV